MKEKNKRKKSFSEEKVVPSVKKLLPHRQYDEKENCYILENGTYMDILQIRAKDLNNTDSNEIEVDCYRFAKFYKTYLQDIKIIVMNYPCNTQKQQHFIQYKIKKCKKSVYRDVLEQSLRELVFLEKNNTSREFYMMFFSEDKEEYQKNLRRIKSQLAEGGSWLIQEIDKKKKDSILFKLNNKNLLIH